MSSTIPEYPEGHALLAGKSVLVTAAAGTGIGFATARRCAEEGARVMLSDIHERRLGEAVDELEKLVGVRPASRLCNVTDEVQVGGLIEAAVTELDGIDVLVNNAGLGGTVPIVEMQDSEWEAVIGVTLTGTFRMTRAVLPHMTERGSGVIVNNASVLGWRAQVGQAHYAAAKAGVMALTRCAALEVADAGIRVNAVSPSLATHKYLSKAIPQEVLDELEQREAYGRGAEPWEVANVIVFLASDYASYMTGECVSVSSQRA